MYVCICILIHPLGFAQPCRLSKAGWTTWKPPIGVFAPPSSRKPSQIMNMVTKKDPNSRAAHDKSVLGGIFVLLGSSRVPKGTRYQKVQEEQKSMKWLIH